MDNILKWLWLTSLTNTTSRDITALLEQCDTIDDIFCRNDYSDVSGLTPLTRLKLKNKNLDKAKKIAEHTAKIGARILTIDDIDYPDMLRNIPNPPYVLYTRGEVMKWDRLLTIGVVGTRSCTEYGLAATRKICIGLAEHGVTVVSGMAAGIDAAASRSALDVGNKTIAVLGNGVDVVYPESSRQLMFDIIDGGGTVISEYPPGTAPNKKHFPWRNRIISGLSRGVLVCEAPEKSGALITARYAEEQGRDVFAVPGSIFKAESEGTNKLLSRFAKPVMSAADILDDYVYEIERLKIKGIEKTDSRKEYKRPKKVAVNNEITISSDDKKYQSLSDDERTIIKLLIENNLHIDDIKRASGFDISKLTTILSMLEFGGYIQKLPGNNYKITV